jgi:hypothetical protein
MLTLEHSSAKLKRIRRDAGSVGIPEASSRLSRALIPLVGSLLGRAGQIVAPVKKPPYGGFCCSTIGAKLSEVQSRIGLPSVGNKTQTKKA